MFIDESGDLGFNTGGSPCFIIAVLMTKRPELVRREMRRVRDFVKGKKRPNEIHWTSSDDRVRCYALKKLAALDVEIHLLMLDKATVYPRLQNVKDKLYHYLAGLILREPIFDDRDVEVIFDKRSKNRFVREDLSTYILNQLSDLSFRLKVRVVHSRSVDDKGIQAVDMISGAAYAQCALGRSKYLDIVRKNIVTEKQLFEKKSRNQA